MNIVDKAPTETDTLRADLEALRAKARAEIDNTDDDYVTGAPEHDALRAELEKPSGASLLAEIASLREQVQPGAIDRALAEAHANGEALEAWKALAKARAAFNIAGDVTALDVASRDVSKALARLRALGIDPEAE